MTRRVPVAVGGFPRVSLRTRWCSSERQRAPSRREEKKMRSTKGKRGRERKHINTSNNSKWHLKPEKTHSSEQQQFCYPEALSLKKKNLFPFTIPLLRREMHPRRGGKTNVSGSSFSVWDSGAFLFVSPLEPSLPWEPCRPGNKQSFVSTDPLCPAARLQTSTPALIGNHRRGVRSGGSFLASTCAFIIAPSKQAKAGRELRCSGDHWIKSFFTNVPMAQTLCEQNASGML